MASNSGKPHGSTEFHRIMAIADALTALDECRSSIGRLKKGFRAQRRSYLGVLAASSKRVSASEKTWKKFIRSEFWKGKKNAPTPADRTRALSFVIRYGENAVTRGQRKNAWR